MNNEQELPLINPSLIEENPNQFWEQVLSFLNKKDIAIERLEKYFWERIIPVLEKAFLKAKYLDTINVPMKKNSSNVNYSIVTLTKGLRKIGRRKISEEPEEYEDVNEDIVVWKYNNEIISKEELRKIWFHSDIITFSKNIINVFEELHESRNSTLRDISKTNEYLKQELNINGANGIQV